MIRNQNQERIGALIKRLRVTSGISQEDLARNIGVSRSALSYIESGLRKVTLDDINQLCLGLGMSIHSFVEAIYPKRGKRL